MMQRRSHLEESRGGSPSVAVIAAAVPVVLAAILALYFGRALFLPLIVAVLLSFLFGPLVASLRRLSIPASLSAAIVIVGCIGVVGYGLYRLAEPAADLIETAPEKLVQIERKLRNLQSSIEKVERTTEKIEDITNGRAATEKMEVKTAGPSLAALVAEGTGPVLFGLAVAVFVLFFLLSSGGRFLRKLVRILPEFGQKKRAVVIARRMQREVSRYILTITIINTGLGTAVGTAFWVLGFPSPVLWGVIVGMLNFVPYLGGLVGVTAISLVSMLSFDTLEAAFWPPAVYFVLNSFEAYLVTPALLGQQFRLDPVAVLVAVVFWTWIWGVPGAILAVPLLVVLKIVCDNVRSLSVVGVFLGR